MSRLESDEYVRELNMYRRVLFNITDITNASEFILLAIFLGRYLNLLYAKIDTNTKLYCTGEHTVCGDCPLNVTYFIQLRNNIIHCNLDKIRDCIDVILDFKVTSLKDKTAIRAVKMLQGIDRDILESYLKILLGE